MIGQCVSFGFPNTCQLQVHPGNFLRQPLTWSLALMEHLISGREHTNQLKTMKYVPTKKLNVKVAQMYSDICASKGRTGFDSQMLDIIHQEVSRVKRSM